MSEIDRKGFRFPVVDPPSQKLMQTLTELKLCSPAELRRARGQVKRLARDLPAFDSIWLDALVQTGTLTPFQGRTLETNNRTGLNVGDYLLLDELSHGFESKSYKAVNRENRTDHYALKTIHLPPEFLPQIESRLQAAVAAMKEIKHRHLAVPQHCFSHTDDQLVLVSQFVEGHHFGELLTRRGRFPVVIVSEIARQVIHALATLESQQLIHGDMRLSNVRLTKQGEVVLTNVGIEPAISPELVLKNHVSPEQYDGIAPELIGTGNPQTVASDIYALGCLLWQLLAGRSPYPTGDPLAKLAAHQTKEIPDVRTWSPDTPAELAELISMMTRRDVSERSASFLELQQRVGAVKRGSRSVLKTFLNRFDSIVPTGEPWETKSSRLMWTSIVLLIAVLGGVGVLVVDRPEVSNFLDVVAKRFEKIKVPTAGGSPNSEAVTASTSQLPEPNLLPPMEARPIANVASSPIESSPIEQVSAELPLQEQVRSNVELHPFPQPEKNGSVLLTFDGPFAAPNISALGELTIVGATNTRPIIVVEDRAARLIASKITLVNVHFRHASPSEIETKASSELVQIQCDELNVTECSFQESFPAIEKKSATGIVWKSATAEFYEECRVELENCRFFTEKPALRLLSSVPEVRFKNCLKRGSGALVLTSQPEPFAVVLQNSTLRGLNSVVHLHRTKTEERAEQVVAIELENSLIDLASSTAPLFGLTGEQPTEYDVSNLFVNGDESFLGENFQFAVWRGRGASRPQEVYEAASDQWEGLMPVSLRFKGEATEQVQNSEVLESSFRGVPRSSEQLPGINSALLPTF